MPDPIHSRLNALVSIAIHRAELHEKMGSALVAEAWREVMLCEQQLVAITPAFTIPGGIARVGAVAAALASGNRQEANRLAQVYRADDSLSDERRRALDRIFQEEDEAYSRKFRGSAKDRLAVEGWRVELKANPSIFPIAA